MKNKVKGVLAAVAAIAALAVGGAAVAGAQSGDGSSSEPSSSEAAPVQQSSEPNESAENEANENESAEQLTGPKADEAAQAALDAVGGGTVLEVEAADDGASGFEVEIRQSDGSEVEVNLDENMNVTSQGQDD